MSILRVPSEIIRIIVDHLKPEDLLRLAASSRHLQYILWDQHTCRAALQKYRFSVEYKEACWTGNYAKVLRRLAKRRDAIQAARPFQVMHIANASHFVYAHGAICYTTGQHTLRVLQLHDPIFPGCVSQELVINIPKLLSLTVFRTICSQESHEYTFKPLHYSNNILSCVFSLNDPRSWKNFLVVCDLKEHRVISHRLIPETRGLFVRNNERYLYYGTKSEPGAGGRKLWVLQGLDLQRSEWLPSRMILRDFVGIQIGSAVCFEIFDGYLYCLSNQQLLEPGETVQNSFYYALRFPLGDIKEHILTKSLQKVVMWRREAEEGPVDERWNTLELSKDEQSGKLFIVETRRELLSAVSQSVRTCYRMELVFPTQFLDDEDDLYSPDIIPNEPYFADEPGDPELDPFWEVDASETRARELLHYGDEEASPITLTFNQTLVPSYNASCQTFIDLVKYPPSPIANSAGKQLRLRTRPQLSGPQPRSINYIQNLLQKSRDMEVKSWPDPSHPRSDVLFKIMNPHDQTDRAESASDERFFVYSTRSFDTGSEERPLILVSFDPALHLMGLPRFYDPVSFCCLDEAENPSNTISCSPRSHIITNDAAFDNVLNKDGAKHPGPLMPGWITKSTANYITQINQGAECGFDMSREPCHYPLHSYSTA